MQHHFNKGVGLFALDSCIFDVDAIKFLGQRRDRREVGGRAEQLALDVNFQGLPWLAAPSPLQQFS